MTKDQFNSEKSFLVSLDLLKVMRSRGIITKAEFTKARKALLKKYKPIISSLVTKS